MTTLPKPTKPVKKAPAATVQRVSHVPSDAYYEKYISRMVGGHQDVDILTKAFEHGLNVLLYGHTGTGKTALALAWAAANEKAFYSIPSNIGIDPSQIFGMYIRIDGEWVWVDGGATDIVRHGGVLLINEVNFMPDRIATVLYGLLDNRREVVLMDHGSELIRAHRPDCWCDLPPLECKERWVLVVADMNPEYSGTRPLNSAFRNRFGIQMNWEWHPQTEEKLVKSEHLLTIATTIRTSPQCETPASTNMLMEFEKLVDALGLDFAISNFLGHFQPEEVPVVRMMFDNVKANLEAEYRSEDEIIAANAGITMDEDSWYNLDVSNMTPART